LGEYASGCVLHVDLFGRSKANCRMCQVDCHDLLHRKGSHADVYREGVQTHSFAKDCGHTRSYDNNIASEGSHLCQLHSCKQQARSYTNVAQAALLHAFSYASLHLTDCKKLHAADLLLCQQLQITSVQTLQGDVCCCYV
jgi:hypothetical protein